MGTNLVGYYRNAGFEILNFDILPPRNPEHLHLWRRVDIRERKQFTEEVVAFKPELILHCAARTDLDEQENLDGYRANFDGICHLIDSIRAVKTVKRTIFFSSQLVCRLGYIPESENDYHPSTLYGRSKALGEQIVRTAADFGSTWTIVRPTSLWGPWFDIPYRPFFTSVRQGLYFHPSGYQIKKQWGFVGNSVYQINALLNAPEHDVHAKTLYLADYDPIELLVFSNEIRSCDGRRPIRCLPIIVLKTIAKAGDLLKMVGWKSPPLTSFRLGNVITDEIQDVEPLRRIVGPLPYDFRQGIQQTIQWLVEH